MRDKFLDPSSPVGYAGTSRSSPVGYPASLWLRRDELPGQVSGFLILDEEEGIEGLEEGEIDD
jgi:hypothetical protein